MSKYADHVARAMLPAWVGEVPPTVWAQTWADRPREVVTLGLRTLSEETLSQVSSLAATRASRYQPNAPIDSDLWIEEYNRALAALTVGRALCVADCPDAPFWDYPDLVAPTALDPNGALWLFSLVSVEAVRTNAITPEQSTTDLLTELIAKLPAISVLPLAKRSMVARFLEAALNVVDDG